MWFLVTGLFGRSWFVRYSSGFGGKVEAGETIEAAAQRELLEESFVTARHLSLRGVLTFNVPSNPTTMVCKLSDVKATEIARPGYIVGLRSRG